MKVAKENQLTKEAGEIAAPDSDAGVSFEPKAGGSYTRDPATGALTKVAGPVPDDQPATE